MPADVLFGPLLGTPEVQAAVSEQAWLQALLDFEAALARVQAHAGLVPEEAAADIAAHCRAELFDAAAIGHDAVAGASPVIPLVRALRAAVKAAAAPHVHRGATSQDALDTAMMLVARSAVDLVLGDLAAVEAACARLAAEHLRTLMAARTLLQQASPTTFGLKAAGWLIAACEAEDGLRWARSRLAAQLGGAAGTMAAFGGGGPALAAALAADLGLADPVLPWHTARARVAQLGAALAVVAGTMGKIALDVVLLAQTEVREAAEPAMPGRGGSSALPHKRNPAGSVEALASGRGAQAQASLLLAAMVQEHERAAGAWQAEWAALSECLRQTAGAVARVREVLSGLAVDSGRMRENLDLTRGLTQSESVATRLGDRLGHGPAHDLVAAAAGRTAAGQGLREVLLADPAVTAVLSPAEIDDALDPAHYIGSAVELVERALAAHRARLREEMGDGG
ncbi:MAG: 3-carboxy-cis,cis-muconate cycloisomerase [Candidatus Dormibacteraeota bacterium]|nr:3-carboxy-cis,cis-muconate cycloisomerase [Candidatus Dormibacteraeota bacterium]